MLANRLCKYMLAKPMAQAWIAEVGTLWQAPDGRAFMVPAPTVDGRYPDWMLDYLIREH